MEIIVSPKNSRVKEWKKLQLKKEREKSGKFIIEGFHLVEEVLKSDYIVEDIIIGEDVEHPSFFTSMPPVKMFQVTKAIVDVLSETPSPQGIFAVCRKKKTPNNLKNYKRVLLVDAVQDPGNVGTIIRTCDAAGYDAVILGDGSVDEYNSKAIRSTQGSLFHIDVFRKNLLDVIEELKEEQFAVYGTSLQNGKEYTLVPKSEKIALLIGNEGNGVSEEVLAQCDENVYIPIYGKAESLNVAIATSILLYHFR